MIISTVRASRFLIVANLCAAALLARHARADGAVTVRVRGEIVDAASGQRVAARVYLQNKEGEWFFPKSENPRGAAVEYKKQRDRSVEMHTSLSADPFVVDLPPGTYTIEIERGKEYLAAVETFRVESKPLDLSFKLKRFVNLAESGWYSGETHVHRPLAELPTLMLAEDLNVAFPLTYWVTKAFTPPEWGDKTAAGADTSELIEVDRTHVIWSRNTEYEIFTVGDKPHPLGAIFAINQRQTFEVGVPPVRPIAEQAHREGALLELDKHNWPWSMVLVPVMRVDLYELSNNHVWRTRFGFGRFGETAPEYMGVETDEQGFTERGWLEFGFRNYYALLNCGFRMRPTAGTASGVHPVPLGFGRVYVHLPGGFRYDDWVAGLNAGRSFVTTGPHLLVQFDGHDPGHTFDQPAGAVRKYRITGRAISSSPLATVEVLQAGEVVATIEPQNVAREAGGFESAIDVPVEIDASTWLAVRCFEKRPDKRPRFAHTAPVHIDVPGRPLRPRRVEVEYLKHRVRSQLDRSRDVLPPAALAEYREALQAYERLAETAR